MHGSVVRRPTADGNGIRLVPARIQCDRRAVRAARQDHGRKPRYPQTFLDRAHGQRRVLALRHPGRRDVSQADAETTSADFDRRICRSRAQARSRQRRRLADLFLSARKLRQVVEQDPRLRKGRRKGPGQAPQRLAVAALRRQVRQAVESRMMEWLSKEWDFAAWSESTKDSAVMGTVDECVEQLKAHLAVGTQKLIFVPYKYENEQIEIIAREIIPRLKRCAAGVISPRRSSGFDMFAHTAAECRPRFRCDKPAQSGGPIQYRPRRSPTAR